MSVLVLNGLKMNFKQCFKTLKLKYSIIIALDCQAFIMVFYIFAGVIV